MMKPGSPARLGSDAFTSFLLTGQLLEAADKCAWRRVPGILVAEYRMYRGQGYNTLAKLQAQDAQLVRMGCESPLAFFKLYGVDRVSPIEVQQHVGVARAPTPSQLSAAPRAARGAGPGIRRAATPQRRPPPVDRVKRRSAYGRPPPCR